MIASAAQANPRHQQAKCVRRHTECKNARRPDEDKPSEAPDPADGTVVTRLRRGVCHQW
jgi:hypothetical protein